MKIYYNSCIPLYLVLLILVVICIITYASRKKSSVEIDQELLEDLDVVPNKYGGIVPGEFISSPTYPEPSLYYSKYTYPYFYGMEVDRTPEPIPRYRFSTERQY